MDRTIAFIGVGIMGIGIVNNLKKTGAKLRLYARNKEKILSLSDSRTEVFDKPSDAVLGAEFIILCLTDDDSIRKEFYGGGILENAKGIILDFGTTSPELTSELNQVCKENGLCFIDSPMSGSKNAARDGQLLFMVGTDSKNCLDSCKFFYDVISKKLILCGASGQGQLAKIALNMIQAGILQSYMEGFILAKKSGVEFSILQEIISESAAKSGISDFKLNTISKRDFSPNFSLKNMNKDLNHALKLAMKLNASLPLSNVLKSVYDDGMNCGFGEEDFSTLMKVNEQRNGL
ncbi:MAG: NAD(P)-dependent oxidoreductase [Leptospiraceae bacterium]|nr:NAD(P)-dependent oxidoreductase [Leptospiraceae bacterium]